MLLFGEFCNSLNACLIPFLTDLERRQYLRTSAVLNTTDLQSGRMLTDHAGRSYDWPWNSTVVSFAPQFAKKAAQVPEALWYT